MISYANIHIFFLLRTFSTKEKKNQNNFKNNFLFVFKKLKIYQQEP
jgi:hypothetical protein